MPLHSTKAEIRVLYDGDAVRDGSMEVRELAPALLALGAACEEANRELNGERATISVRVRSDVQRGSFTVTLDIWQQLRSVLLGNDLAAARILVALLFGGGSVWQIVKWLRGRRPVVGTALQTGNVEIRIEGDQNEVTVVRSDAVRLYNNPVIRQQLQAIAAPLRQPGIDVLKIGDEEALTKAEAASFVEPMPAEQVVAEGEQEGVYEIQKLSFTDRYKWTFSDGNATFNASIEDEDFFERVQSRRISFASGDVLRVRLWRRSVQTEHGMRTEYSVRKVLEHIPAPRQIDLI